MRRCRWCRCCPSLAAAAMEESGSLLEPERCGRPRPTPPATTSPTCCAASRTRRPSARLVDRVTALTGLDRQVVARAAGRIDAGAFARETLRDERQADQRLRRDGGERRPDAGKPGARAADPVLDAMTAPLTSAMLAHYRDTLGWLPDRRYMLLNRGVSRAWDWDDGRGQPEAVGALRRVLALDPEFRRAGRARLHRPRHALLRAAS